MLTGARRAGVAVPGEASASWPLASRGSASAHIERASLVTTTPLPAEWRATRTRRSRSVPAAPEPNIASRANGKKFLVVHGDTTAPQSEHCHSRPVHSSDLSGDTGLDGLDLSLPWTDQPMSALLASPACPKEGFPCVVLKPTCPCRRTPGAGFSSCDPVHDTERVSWMTPFSRR